MSNLHEDLNPAPLQRDLQGILQVLALGQQQEAWGGRVEANRLISEKTVSIGEGKEEDTRF